MAEVASAFVSVMPSAKGFGSKLNSEIGGDLDSSGKKLGSKFGAALKVGATAALGGALIAGKFLADSIEEAREAQKVGALTESTIKATGRAANVTAKQVGDLAEAISRKTGIDDETIQSGQNMLLTFKNIRNEVGKGNDIFNQSTKTLVDLSAAMGTEPKQAAIQLGKALNDPIKGVSALSRVGVTFTDQQKKQIETMVESGRTMDAQKVILGELNSEFGGAAEAQATAGDKMSVAWGNLKESAGNAILPIVDTLVPKLTSGLNTISDSIRTGDWSGAWSKFKTASKSALGTVTSGVKDFASKRLVPAIGNAVGSAHKRWANGWSNFSKDPEKSYDETIQSTKNFGKKLQSQGKGVAFGVVMAFGRAMQGLPRVAAKVGVSAINSLQRAWAGAPGLARHIAVDIAGSFAEGLRGMPGAASSIGTQVLVAFRDGLSGLASAAVSIGANIVQGLIDGILSKLPDVGGAVGRIAQEVRDHFPGSPVKKGPLTSWNNGGAGKRLVGLLADGLGDTRPVTSAMDRLSAGIAVRGPGALSAATAGAGGSGRAVFHIYDRDDVLLGTMEGVADGRIHGAAQLAGETARAM